MSEDVSMQLSCYAMYAMDKWGVDPENVKLILYAISKVTNSPTILEFRVT